MSSFDFKNTLPMKIFKGVLFISGLIGTIWGIYRLIDLIYANMGSKYRPTEEFDNFLENIGNYLKNETKV